MQNMSKRMVLSAIFILGLGMLSELLAAGDTAPSSLTETYGDWIVHCANGASEHESGCEMIQELRQQSTGQRVLVMSVRQSEGNGDINIIAPFGLDLSKGLQLSIADEVLSHFGFWTCLPGGCVVKGPLETALLSQLKSGDIATVHVTQTNSQSVELGVSLAGFSAAWNRLQQL